MAIAPDTKDWSWVLDRPCPQCGFVAGGVDPDEIGALIRANVAEWQVLLADERVGDRPADDRWSALEYGCHVRDVFVLYDTRLHLMLDEDGPTFANWDQDVTAVEARYREQDPAVVAADLRDAGGRLADSFDAVGERDWARTGTRSDGVHFTIESFGRYLVHDPVHHVLDVRQGFARLAGR